MHKLYYKGEKIEFKLRRKAVKNINLRVKVNQEVCVSANKTVPLAHIEEFIRKNGDWILDNLQKFREIQARRRDLIGIGLEEGDCFSFLGQDYRLTLVPGPKNQLDLVQSVARLQLRQPENFEARQRTVRAWYRAQAQDIFQDSLERMYRLVEPYGLAYPVLNYRLMKRRWGSCYYNKGKIILNTQLVKYGQDSIDYVCLHELVHFIHNNHSQDFYQLMTQLMPDWQERRKKLNGLI